MKAKTCFNLLHLWQEYRTSWQLKDMTGDSSHYVDLALEDWEAAVTSMMYHLRRTLVLTLLPNEETSTLLAEIQACLNSRPLCTISNEPFNPTNLSPGHFLIGEILTQLPAADHTLNATDFPGGRSTNNFSSSGNDGHPTTSRAFNSVNDGKGHLLTYK